MRPPIEPMRAAGVATLPDPRSRRLVYEPKWDGWRCVARVGDPTLLHSRQGRDLTRYFPDVAEQVRAHLPHGVIVDGELVCWDPDRGRTSFTRLQRRITAGHALPREATLRPAHLVVFDLLADAGGTPTIDWPLARRRARLESLLTQSPPQLPVCPQTEDPDEARRWLDELADVGVEGLVIKDLAGRYTPGRTGWLKLKRRTTTEAVVGGVTGSLTDPNTLLLGRFDADGRLRYVARTHPLAAAHRHELADLLAPRAGAVHHGAFLAAAAAGTMERPVRSTRATPLSPCATAHRRRDTRGHRLRRRPRAVAPPGSVPAASDGIGRI